MVDYLTKQTDIIIDNTDFNGQTALLLSTMHLTVPDEISIKLINAGADVNKASNSLTTPLHCAVNRRPAVAELLIKQGADLNAQELTGGYTPLHKAIENNNFETTSMLLYYGADVSITNDYNLTPFMFTLVSACDLELQQLLLEYEADVNMYDSEGYSTLLIAMNWRSEIVVELIKRGADISYQYGKANIVTLLFAYADNEIFREVWSVIHPDLLEQMDADINMLFSVARTSDEWFERMNMVLESDKAEILIQKHSDFLNNLIITCHRRDLREEDAYQLVCMSLMYGAEVTYKDVKETYELYGFNGIMKLLLHVGVEVKPWQTDLVLPYFICRIPSAIPREIKNCEMCRRCKRYITHLLNYVTSIDFLCESCHYRYLKNAEVPSLKELAREAVRKAIAFRYKPKSTLMFYTIVNGLNVPYVLKRFISYEIPLHF